MEASEEEKVLATALLLVGCGLKMKNRTRYKQKRRVWVNDWLKQHTEKGHYYIVQELRLWDSAGLFGKEMFQFLLSVSG